MNQRERILAIGVGAVIALFGLQYLWNYYSSEVTSRKNEIASLEERLLAADAQLENGMFADAQMERYRERSLPSNPELARSEYLKWLVEWSGKHFRQTPKVSFTNRTGIGDLYSQYNFSVSGPIKMEDAVDLLHEFHQKNYLHRIANFSLRKTAVIPGRATAGSNDVLSLTMSLQAVALNDAPPENAGPMDVSPLIQSDLEDYRTAIMNRNFFQPPNQSPRIDGRRSVDTVIGRTFTYEVDVRDPDGHEVDVDLIGEVPDGVEISGKRIRVRRDEEGDVRIAFRATDKGWPSQSAEGSVLIRFYDPPPEKVEEGPPAFDDSTQTRLTALLGGKDGFTAWLRVRTKGTTLRVRKGDQIEVGTITAVVKEVNERSVVFQHEDGDEFTMTMDQSLADAAKL